MPFVSLCLIKSELNQDADNVALIAGCIRYHDVEGRLQAAWYARHAGRLKRTSERAGSLIEQRRPIQADISGIDSVSISEIDSSLTLNRCRGSGSGVGIEIGGRQCRFHVRMCFQVAARTIPRNRVRG